MYTALQCIVQCSVTVSSVYVVQCNVRPHFTTVHCTALHCSVLQYTLHYSYTLIIDLLIDYFNYSTWEIKIDDII